MLILEENQSPNDELVYPVCIAGERAAPPEDVGGPLGYEDFLKAISNRRDKRHREMMEWIGGSFDPEHFDLSGVNRRLRMRFPRRKAR